MSMSPQLQSRRLCQPKVSLKRLVSLLCVLAVGLFVLSGAVPVFADDDSSTTGGWKEFKSEKYNFRCLFPGAPQESRNPGNDLPQFEYKGDSCIYNVLVEPQSNSPFIDSTEMDKIWHGFLKTCPDVTDVSDISGDGWKGKSFNVVKSGNACAMRLLVVKGGYLYLLSVVGATPAHDRDKFFDSFKGHDTGAFMVGCIIVLVCLGVGFLFMVGIGVGVFFLIKHNNKKKPQ